MLGYTAATLRASEWRRSPFVQPPKKGVRPMSSTTVLIRISSTPCRTCGRPIYLAKTSDGYRLFNDPDAKSPHACKLSDIADAASLPAASWLHCRRCGEPVVWLESDGRLCPFNRAGAHGLRAHECHHRERCSSCGKDIHWIVGAHRPVDANGYPHSCVGKPVDPPAWIPVDPVELCDRNELAALGRV